MIDPFSDVGMYNNTQPASLPRYLPNKDNQKLPKIQKQKETMIAKLSKKFIKSSNKLPNVKIENNLNTESQQKKNCIQNNTQGLFQNIRGRQKSQGDDFASQIQKKLKVVLDGQNNINNYQEASDSDEEFQKKINKHREIIRQQRIKRQAVNESIHLSQQNIGIVCLQSQKKKQYYNSNQQTQKVIVKGQKSKLNYESIYEKRIKDYREQSIGNKFLIKKKQIAQKQHILPFKKIQQIQQQIIPANFHSLKNKLPESNINLKKKISKAENHSNKDEQLFQNIHNILLNPIRRSQNDMVKEKPKKIKQALQQKLKDLQRKINEQRKEDLELLFNLEKSNKKQINNLDIQIKASNLVQDKDEYLNWRKINVTNMEVKRMNFEDEVERVNKYFQKSERSLEKYIQNQRKILGLSLMKKIKQSMFKIKA